jgi:hypothetical protein
MKIESLKFLLHILTTRVVMGSGVVRRYITATRIQKR